MDLPSALHPVSETLDYYYKSPFNNVNNVNNKTNISIFQRVLYSLTGKNHFNSKNLRSSTISGKWLKIYFTWTKKIYKKNQKKKQQQYSV